MKKKLFIFLFIIVHLFFVFSQIHKQSYFIQLSYEQQKYKKLEIELIEKKQQLKYELQLAQNSNQIKKNAIQKLGMQKVPLNKIKKLEEILKAHHESL